MTVRLVALHGFLGHASDWDVVAAALGAVSARREARREPAAPSGSGAARAAEAPHDDGRPFRITHHAVDLWEVLADRHVHDWASASAAVDRALATTVPDASSGSCRTFVIAYSLGARLALGSALLASRRSPVRGCCFVSCNPGLGDGDAAMRESRRLSDEAWARRILDEPEGAIWRAWDSQPVFAGSGFPASRGALPAPRVVLSRALKACSLAAQPDLRSRLLAWPTPVLWMTGARDAKFAAIARELSSAGVAADFVECERAGHRVPWDNPPAFAAALLAWIERVMENER